MTATMDGGGLASETEGPANGYYAKAAEEPITVEGAGQHGPHTPLPWIGASPNPRLGPMVVLNDSGYLVPLCTAGDLVRGCRYFWQRARE